MVGPDEAVEGGEQQVGDELFDLLASTVAHSGLELVDLEVRPGLVRLVVDGPGGAQLDAIADATRAVSGVLDAHDPLPGSRYSLEVSSPGVERPLRTPAHYARAVGETVTVRTVAGGPGARRFTGRLVSSDDEGFVIRCLDEGGTVSGEASQEMGEGGDEDATLRFAYGDVERARTVFEWGASDKPRSGASTRRGAGGRRGTDRKKVTTP
jgi:ribosome maturation factor RimP